MKNPFLIYLIGSYSSLYPPPALNLSEKYKFFEQILRNKSFSNFPKIQGIIIIHIILTGQVYRHDPIVAVCCFGDGATTIYSYLW